MNIHLDGTRHDYEASSFDDFWLFYFTYQHSTHNVLISLTADSFPQFDTDIGNLIIAGITVATIVLTCVEIAFYLRK